MIVGEKANLDVYDNIPDPEDAPSPSEEGTSAGIGASGQSVDADIGKHLVML